LWDKLGTEGLANHKGRIVGCVLGFIFPLMVLRFGFWYTMLISFCTYAGYHIGRRIDENHETLVEIVDRYLPGNDRQ